MVFDVGANRGQFSLDVRRAAPSAKLVAFEPLDSEANIYEKIFAPSRSCTLHRVALGTGDGEAELHLSASLDSSSLYSISDQQTRLFPGTESVGTEVVRVRTLDQYESAIGPGANLLKLDVQGAELDVLRGANGALQRFRWVYAEVSFVELYEGQPLAAEVISHLEARGFDLVHTGVPLVRNGLSVQNDVLFQRR